MSLDRTLSGLSVVETPGRLGGAICAGILAELGAQVVRLEDEKAGPRPALYNHPVATAGKTRLRRDWSEPSKQTLRRRLVSEADIVISAPGDDAAAHAVTQAILCLVSAAGGDGDPALPPNASEVLIQAHGGLMATTGDRDGPSCRLGVPMLEILTGVDAATAVLAALRQVANGMPPPRLDMAVADTSASLLGPFLAQVTGGKASGFRYGCRHPICAPWNAYPTCDGRVLICSSSDERWRRILDIISAEGEKHDPRFVEMAARMRHAQEVDALIGAWTAGRTAAEIVSAMTAHGIPASPIRSPHDLLQDPTGPRTASFRREDGRVVRHCRLPLRLTGSGRARPMPTIPRRAGPALPLTGIRVIEIGAFTAGPLGGRFLADLGAEVVKVEPPGGDISRAWSPQVGGVSGYFGNYNAGKRSVVLDLSQPPGQSALSDLLQTADVLLQNIRPGALDRPGSGVQSVLQAHPGLIYCSVSGFGTDGSQAPALDTVIQGDSGIMPLVDHPEGPCTARFSLGDLFASHLAPLAVLVALHRRDRTGEGGHIDISMLDGLFWATQLGWDDAALDDMPFCRLAAADGWVVTDATPAERVLGDLDLASTPIETILARLRDHGIDAVRVRDLGEIIADPHLRRRGMMQTVRSADGTPLSVLGSPVRLSREPLRVGDVRPLESDGGMALMRDWGRVRTEGAAEA